MPLDALNACGIEGYRPASIVSKSLMVRGTRYDWLAVEATVDVKYG